MSELLCPTCQTPYRSDQLACNKCGRLLFDPRASTVHVRVDPALMRLRRKRAQTTGPSGSNPAQLPGFMVCLQIRGLNERIFFEDGTELVLGRLDLSNPDLSRFDLTRFGGHERGVSREHCLLRYRDGQLTVTDLGSINGSRLNLDRLIPNEPRSIKDGDTLVLGSLSITIRFEGTTEPPLDERPDHEATKPKGPSIPAEQASWASQASQVSDGEDGETERLSPDALDAPCES